MDTATDAIDASYYYDAFGNILESTGSVDNSIKYAGYQYDDETGYYYLNARIMTRLRQDSCRRITYLEDPNDSLSLNLYTYVSNNPLIYVDPMGYIQEKGAGITIATTALDVGNTWVENNNNTNGQRIIKTGLRLLVL